MKTAEQLLIVAQETTRALWATARRLHGPKVGSMPTVAINKRLRTTAGRAWIDETPGRVDFCYSLMAEFTAHFIRDTIPHELSHIIAYRVYKEPNHGPAWKDVMIGFGIKNPQRCHDLIEQRRIKQIAKQYGFNRVSKNTMRACLNYIDEINK